MSTASSPPEYVCRASLRRQPAHLVDGTPDGGYTDSFEIICRDCGDNPRWEYHDAPPRLQRLRGPYWLTAGTAKYVAHIQWHDKLIHAQR
jgi:hypothetical protein